MSLIRIFQCTKLSSILCLNATTCFSYYFVPSQLISYFCHDRVCSVYQSSEVAIEYKLNGSYWTTTDNRPTVLKLASSFMLFLQSRPSRPATIYKMWKHCLSKKIKTESNLGFRVLSPLQLGRTNIFKWMTSTTFSPYFWLSVPLKPYSKNISNQLPPQQML